MVVLCHQQWVLRHVAIVCAEENTSNHSERSNFQYGNSRGVRKPLASRMAMIIPAQRG